MNDSIVEVIDNIIEKVTTSTKVNNISFYKAYDTRDYSMLLGGFTALVDIKEIKKHKGFISRLYKNGILGDVFTSKLVIRLYGGNYVTGESLTTACVELREEVISADEDGFIEDNSIGPISYESDTGNIYRELEFDFEYVLCEAVL